MRITEVTDIQAGYQFRGGVEPDPNGRVAVLQVKDLKSGEAAGQDGLVRVSMDKDVSPYTVGPGDVLFLSRGHRVFATAVGPLPQPTIVPNYFYILRPKTHVVLAAYLAWVINSPKAQAQLKLVHAGSHMPIVTKTDFEELNIDVPPLSVQRTIVALAELARHEQQLLRDLSATKQQLIDQLCSQAASVPASKRK